MPEPVSLTLGSVAMFLRLFDLCNTLYHAYKVTGAFGTDFEAIQISLNMQWVRLDSLKSRRLSDLREELDPNDENHRVTYVVLQLLAQMKRYFQTCNELMKKYDGKDDHGPLVEDDAATLGSTSTSQIKSPDGTLVSQAVPKPSKSRQTGRKSEWKSRILGKKLKSKTEASKTAATGGEAPTHSYEMKILKSNEVKVELARQKQEAKTLKESTSLPQKVRWHHHDRETLRSMIKELRHGNNDLECILQVRPPKDASRTLSNNDDMEAYWPVAIHIEQALICLHDDLMVVNIKKGSRDPFMLSLQLKEDHNENRDDLDQEPTVHLRDDSFVFNLQRHTSGSWEHDSSLLSVETASARSSTQFLTSKPTELHNLDRPTKIEVPPLRQLVEKWGYFPANGSEKMHVVYHDTQGQWSSRASLADILTGTDFRHRILPVQVVQLARTITSAHLYLDAVRRKCVDPRPKNYRFYQTSDEPDIWDDSRPLVLRPWISFGFGQRPPPRKLGGGNGPARAPNTSMIELGLVLYQLGSGTNLEYGLGASGLAAAKTEALKGLNVLDRRVGATYVIIVRDMLEFKASASYLTASNAGKDETKYVKKAISSLLEYEQLLENTVVAPDMALISEEREDTAEELTSDLAHLPTRTDNNEVCMSLPPQPDNNASAGISEASLSLNGLSLFSQSTAREMLEPESLDAGTIMRLPINEPPAGKQHAFTLELSEQTQDRVLEA